MAAEHGLATRVEDVGGAYGIAAEVVAAVEVPAVTPVVASPCFGGASTGLRVADAIYDGASASRVAGAKRKTRRVGGDIVGDLPCG